ncbi:MAG: peptide ABC transporter substrate-binding protein [Chloroflexota bacterium]
MKRPVILKLRFLLFSILLLSTVVGCLPDLFTSVPSITPTTIHPQDTPELISSPGFVSTPESTSTPEPTPHPRTLVICLGSEPASLYYYNVSMLTERQVLEAVYDGPIDYRSHGYQPVILEKLPSLADGDALIQPMSVKAGDRVVDEHGDVVVLEGGVRVFPSGCNLPDCAVTYGGQGEILMDRMIVTFRLLPGLKWSDGAPLTAHDSVYSFRLAADTYNLVVSRTLVSWISSNVSAYVIERTVAYDALDNLTIQWVGLPGFMDQTYFVNFWIPLPRHIWEQYSPIWLHAADFSNLRPMGWGPYVIKEWIAGDHITMYKNLNYFRSAEGLPKFDYLIYRFVGNDADTVLGALISGECDLLDIEASYNLQNDERILSLQAQGQLKMNFVPGTIFEHVVFNIRPFEAVGLASLDEDGNGVGPFGDVRLRQAIALCLDRQAVVDSVMFGSIVLDSYLPTEHPLSNPGVTRYPYDPTAASILLDEIGWLDNDDNPATPRRAQGVTGVPEGTLLEFSFETTTFARRRQATQILAESMARCGIKVNLVYHRVSEWYADGPGGRLYGRKFDMGLKAWVTEFRPSCELWMTENIPGDPTLTDKSGNPLYPMGWGGENVSGYSNPEYDQACKTALSLLPGQPGYIEAYMKTQEIFARDLPAIPLYNLILLAVTRPDMCGFRMDPTDSSSEMWNIEAFDYGPGCK